MEQELAHAVNASSKSMDRVYGKPRAAEVPAPSRPCPRHPPALGPSPWFCSGSSQGLSCSLVLEMVNNVRALRSETELLLGGRLALVSWGPTRGTHTGSAAPCGAPDCGGSSEDPALTLQ